MAPATALLRPRVEPASPPAVHPKPARLAHIDALRGFVMALMALDHVRSFFHTKAIVFDPTDLTQTTPGIFFTRWITHLCAPIFVLLAGAAANLSSQRGRDPATLAHFLRTRGLWLVFVELTIVKFGWTFSLDFHSVTGQVIWATGWAMIVLSFLIRLPSEWVLKGGAVGLVLHGLFVLIPSEAWGIGAPVWSMFVSGDEIEWMRGYEFASKYPILPWSALLALGYGIGPAFSFERPARRRIFSLAGLACVAAYVPVRWVETGGRAAWTEGPAAALWILDAEKYPPSLTFFLMTLGIGFLLLAALDRDSGPVMRRFARFGRVPFFFYVLHLPVIHALAVLAEHFLRQDTPPFPAQDWRLGLPVVYGLWLAVVLFMYPACKWFADLKRRRHDPWLSYL